RGDHVTQSAERQEHAEYARQERRSRNKVSDRDALNSEKRHADGKNLQLKLESDKRHRVYLSRCERRQVLITMQQKQRREMDDPRGAADRDSGQAKERPQQ